VISDKTWSADMRAMLVGASLVVAVVLVVAVGMDRIMLDAFLGFLTLVAITLVAVPTLLWVARREGEPAMARMLVAAFSAKIVGTLLRYFVITVLYSDNADAGVYSGGGQFVAANLRSGVLDFHIPQLAGRGSETERIAQVVGVIYTVTGDSRYAGSFVFASLCFTGQVLMWRAFKRAVPEGDHHRYALLVLFLPSLLFWPSSIGKEALMLFSVGVVSYGAAQILGERVRTGGIVTFLLGVSGLLMIRPHMAVIALVALGFASLVGTLAGFKRSASPRIFVVRVLALAVLVVAASVAVSQTSRVLGSDRNSDESGVSSVLAKTEEQTKQGGSEFAAVTVSSPVELPAGIVTVLFRPFPWEAHSLNGLIAAAEGLLLIGLFVVGRRRLITWAKTVFKRPYLVYCTAYAFTFIVTFSYIANFGILARQRTQMLPLVLTMIAMYPAPRTRTSWLGAKPTPLEGDADLDERGEGGPRAAAGDTGVPAAGHAR